MISIHFYLKLRHKTRMAFVKKNRKMTQEKENICRDVAKSFHNSSYSSSPYLNNVNKNNNNNNNNNKKYLRPCLYLERCNKRADGRCGFAHSIDELQPLLCMFDEQCNKFGNGCIRFHPSLQTKEEYCELSGFSFTLPNNNNEIVENGDEKQMNGEMNEVMDAIENMAEHRIQELQDEIDFLEFVDQQVTQQEMEEQMKEMAAE